MAVPADSRAEGTVMSPSGRFPNASGCLKLLQGACAAAGLNFLKQQSAKRCVVMLHSRLFDSSFCIAFLLDFALQIKLLREWGAASVHVWQQHD